MATYSGIGGDCTFAANGFGELQSWEINATAEILDDTEMGDKWTTAKGGLASWTGSAVMRVDYDDTAQAAAIVDVLQATPSGDSVALVFQVASGKTFGGNALVSGVQIGGDKGGYFEATLSFTGNGALTPTWA